MKYLIILFSISVAIASCDQFHRHCDGEFEHNFFHYIQALDTLQADEFEFICVNDSNCKHILEHLKEDAAIDLANVPEPEKEQSLKEYEAELLAKWTSKKQHRDAMYKAVLEEGKKYNVKWSEVKLLSYGRVEDRAFGVEKNKGEVRCRNESYSFILPFEALLIDNTWKISDLGKLQKKKLKG